MRTKKLCTRCGKREATPGYAMCLNCRHAARVWSQKFRREHPECNRLYRQSHPECDAWMHMLYRCLPLGNPKCKDWPSYGGRGIRVCQRWIKYENFLADMGKRPGPGYSLERRNNSKGYRPSNCYWATRSQQERNKRSRLVSALDFGSFVFRSVNPSPLLTAMAFRKLTSALKSKAGKLMLASRGKIIQ